ncbi:MAG: ribonuclease E/G, partial [Sporomusaceae bacterium]|nr:ribonuclease E/G [Sporomusaceae bacterium]
MSKKIIANILPEETRVALLENGRLAEISIERKDAFQKGKIVGNIYKGRVKNVLPGMQAAFIDTGTGKNAFFYIGRGGDKKKPLTLGQEIMVQVIKDSIGGKGSRVTVNLTLPGRY